MIAKSTIFSLTIVGFLVSVMAAQAFAEGPCKYTVPEGWNPARVQWNGACETGVANGLGILKELGGKEGDRFFFGRLKNGVIEFGVIADSDGFQAGRFENGRWVNSHDRQVFVDAFAEGEKAALQAADRYSKAGNKASAKFYQDMAKKLKEQLD